ncbi:MAG: hypothetical protein QXR32_02800 [Candidatus Caldarchaeum sp.]
MRCYFHRDAESVGVCCHCHRAVCVRCAKYDGHGVFCPEHNEKTYSLSFTRHYLMAIELAREAAAKGMRTMDVIESLEKQMKEFSSR